MCPAFVQNVTTRERFHSVQLQQRDMRECTPDVCGWVRGVKKKKSLHDKKGAELNFISRHVFLPDCLTRGEDNLRLIETDVCVVEFVCGS